MTISYYSRTHLFLMGAPLVWTCITFGVVFCFYHPHNSDDPVITIFGTLLLLTFVWVFLCQAMGRDAYQDGSQRILGVDISKNFEPSRAERFAMTLNRVASVPLGLACAWWLVAIVGHGHAKSDAIGGVVVILFVPIFFVIRYVLVTIEMPSTGFRLRPLRDREKNDAWWIWR